MPHRRGIHRLEKATREILMVILTHYIQVKTEQVQDREAEQAVAEVMETGTGPGSGPGVFV